MQRSVLLTDMPNGMSGTQRQVEASRGREKTSSQNVDCVGSSWPSRDCCRVYTRSVYTVWKTSTRNWRQRRSRPVRARRSSRVRAVVKNLHFRSEELDDFRWMCCSHGLLIVDVLCRASTALKTARAGWTRHYSFKFRSNFKKNVLNMRSFTQNCSTCTSQK